VNIAFVRHAAAQIACLFGFAATLPGAFAQSVDDRFAPIVTGEVRALAVLADGAVLIGGDFSAVDAQPHRNLVRVKAGGAADTVIAIDADGPVDALLVQSDGKVLVGGRFQQVNGSARSHLARLNADGSLDGAFNASVDGGVAAIAVQSDGKIVVGGVFAQAGGQPRAHAARLNADGSLDATFRADTDAAVQAIGVQRDGRIVLAGAFAQVGGQAHAYLARVDAAGAPDAGFAPAPDAAVRLLQVQADDSLVVGGDFNQIGAAPRRHLARLNRDGSLASAYAHLQGDFVPQALATQPDGKLIAAGDGSVEQDGQTRTRIARFASDGSLDAALRSDEALNAAAIAVAVQSDGKLVLGGAFSQVGAEARAGVARLHADGALEKAVVTAANELVRTAAVQADGKTLIGGNFTEVQGTPRSGLARLNADGTLDTAFAADANGQEVRSIVLQGDGHILVGGLFFGIGGGSQPYLVRLAADGSADASFAPAINDGVNTVAQQTDGKIVIAGYFTQVNGQAQRYLARLNADGTLDAGFAPALDVAATLLTMQSDGRIVVGGFFTQVNGQPRQYLARLNADGSLDANFAPDPDWLPQAVLQQKDGKLLLGGPFFRVYGQYLPWLVRFNLDGTLDETFASFDPQQGNNIVTVNALAQQADGKLLVGGAISGIHDEAHANIARLNLDGTLDDSFSTQVDVMLGVYTIAVQADGAIWIGGDLSAVDGIARDHLARLPPTEAALQSMDLADASTRLQWRRSGTAPEFSRAEFALSLDGTAWNDLGAGQPGADGWSVSGLSVPRNAPVWLRARGHVPSGFSVGSESLLESMRLVYLPGFNATAAANEGGRIEPPIRGVDAGATATFTLTPDAGYQIDRIGGSCGGSLSGNVFTTAPLQADCTVEAVFVAEAERIFADGFETR
jgi:uncharacterized delta-60 repeat protein